MTLPIDLNLIWAEGGGVDDPGKDKYQLGWISEIPTYENFNYVLKALDTNILAYAEADIFPWQEGIAYQAGARVTVAGKTFYCIQTHNDSNNTNPQNPTLDNTFSYWVNGTVFSSVADAFSNLKASEGLKLDHINARQDGNVWDGNDVTIEGLSNLIALYNDSAGASNWILANVGGQLVAVDVANTKVPDGRDLRPSANDKSYKLYHQGFPPKQADVEGTIPDAPSDGTIYARKSKNWVRVTTVTSGVAPPEAASGSGAGWYNTEDGQFYLDVNDGDSSQWVVANPPISPELVAVGVDYNNTASGLNATEVQSAIDELAARPIESRKNLLTNGGLHVNQRKETGWEAGVGNFGDTYTADRWRLFGITGQLNLNGSFDTTDYPNPYFAFFNGFSGNLQQRIPVDDVKQAAQDASYNLTFSFQPRGTAATNGESHVLQLLYYWADSSGVAIGSQNSVSKNISMSLSNSSFGERVQMTGKDLAPMPSNAAFLTVRLQFSTPMEAGQTLRMAAMKLEWGDVATEYVSENYADELLRSQRFYEIVHCTLDDYMSFKYNSANNTNNAEFNCSYNRIVNYVPKYRNPTMTVLSTALTPQVSVAVLEAFTVGGEPFTNNSARWRVYLGNTSNDNGGIISAHGAVEVDAEV